MAMIVNGLKRLKIHECRLGGAYSNYSDSGTLIEQLYSKEGKRKYPCIIYKGAPDNCSKLTEVSPKDRETMLSGSGEYTIVETPGDVATTLMVISAVLSVAAAAYAFYVASQTSDSDTTTENRTISSRSNSQRPLERIEDRAGTNLIYPALIQKPYSKFESKREVEFSLMSIGVGWYKYYEDYVYDGSTTLKTISYEAACFYDPYVMPGDSSDASLIIGDAFDETVRTVYQSSAVSGGESLPVVSDIKTSIDSGDLALETFTAGDEYEDKATTYTNDSGGYGSLKYYSMDTAVTGLYELEVTLMINEQSDSNYDQYNIAGPLSIYKIEGLTRINYSDSNGGFNRDVAISDDAVHTIKVVIDTGLETAKLYIDGIDIEDDLDMSDLNPGSTFDLISVYEISKGLDGSILSISADGVYIDFNEDASTATEFTNQSDGSNNATPTGFVSTDVTQWVFDDNDSPDVMSDIDNSGEIISLTLVTPTASSTALDLSSTTWARLTMDDDSQYLTDYIDDGILITTDIDIVIGESEGEDVITTLSGSYMVVSATEDELIIAAPGYGSVTTVDGDWSYVIDGTASYNNGTAKVYPSDTEEATYLGPYFLGGDDRDNLFANFVASSGLKDADGDKISITIAGQYAKCDSIGNRIGGWVDIDDVKLSGNTYNRIGVTQEVDTKNQYSGPVLYRCRRVTGAKSGTDDVTLDALHGSAPVDVDNFGNVSTVQTRTVARGLATQVTERDFNLLTTRMIQKVLSAAESSTSLDVFSEVESVDMDDFDGDSVAYVGGIVWDDDEKLIYMIDRSGDRIITFDEDFSATGDLDYYIGSQAGAASGIAKVGDDIYVVDSSTKEVSVFTPGDTGLELGTVYDISAHSAYPRGLAYDPSSGAFYVAENSTSIYGYRAIIRFDSDFSSASVTEVTDSCPNPEAMTVNNGFLYVFSDGDDAIVRFSLDLGTVYESMDVTGYCRGITFTDNYLWVPKNASDGTAVKYQSSATEPALSTNRYATNRFIDYYVYACTSDYIGRQSIDNIDLNDLLDQYETITEYFGDTNAAEFCYSFDDDQVSFQDHADAICAAAFSIPTRKNGSTISSKFEQPQVAPRTIFTHRNKIPGEQTITRTFHTDDRIDGIEYQWIDPDNSDEIATIYIPEDNSATKPEKIESVGVRNYQQAYWAAYRRYNKIMNQRKSVSDMVTAEGTFIEQLDMIGITNDTSSPYYAGEVTGVSGLVLYLNQTVEFESGYDYSISLRNRDGSIDIISCTEGPTTKSVTLYESPSETPYTGTDERRTVFTMQKDDNLGADYYVVNDVDRTNPQKIEIGGYNYTDNYYANDTDTPTR